MHLSNLEIAARYRRIPIEAKATVANYHQGDRTSTCPSPQRMRKTKGLAIHLLTVSFQLTLSSCSSFSVSLSRLIPMLPSVYWEKPRIKSYRGAHGRTTSKRNHLQYILTYARKYISSFNSMYRWTERQKEAWNSRIHSSFIRTATLSFFNINRDFLPPRSLLEKNNSN